MIEIPFEKKIHLQKMFQLNHHLGPPRLFVLYDDHSKYLALNTRRYI